MKLLLLGAFSLGISPFAFFSGSIAVHGTISHRAHLLTGSPAPYVRYSAIGVFDFHVQRLGQGRVLLSWHTEGERNSEGFYIERKRANEDFFVPVASLPSKPEGGPASILDYSFTDVNGYDGTSYYRIRQKDRKGTNYYTAVKAVR